MVVVVAVVGCVGRDPSHLQTDELHIRVHVHVPIVQGTIPQRLDAREEREVSNVGRRV